jgi:hypothetical protein
MVEHWRLAAAIPNFGTLFLADGNVFRLCKPHFPLDIEMIIFS